MRIAVLGAAVSALLGGTLAVTPLTSVSTPLPATGPCGTGVAVCDKVASVLMPETPKPSGPQAEPAAQAGGAPTQFSEAANVPGPGVPPGPAGGPAAAAVPGVSAPGIGVGGGAPAAAVPGGGLPGVPDVGLPGVPDAGLPDVAGILPQLPGAITGAAAIYEAPAAANAAWSIVQGVVGSGATIVGVGTGVVATASTAAIALAYLKNAGLLPSSIGLSGISLPAIPGISLPAAAAAVPGAAAAIPAVMAAVQQVSLPALPALPAMPALPALPALPAAPPALPALPALPAAPPALPALPALPAPPPLPGPPPIPPHPHLCTPGIGPLRACTP